jgi:hypothetical protein
VAGYDGSETSRAGVARAAQRAGRSGKVYAVHSVGGPGNGAGSEHEQRGKAMLDALLLEGDALVDVDPEVLRLADRPVTVVPAQGARERQEAVP